MAEHFVRTPNSSAGKYVQVEHVHHIKPLSESGSHNDENLMSLCSACHAKIHAERDDRRK